MGIQNSFKANIGVDKNHGFWLLGVDWSGLDLHSPSTVSFFSPYPILRDDNSPIIFFKFIFFGNFIAKQIHSLVLPKVL